MSEMSSRKLRTIELLAPAKNYEQGRAAILCGADALYVGAPRFGARSAAGVPEEEIVPAAQKDAQEAERLSQGKRRSSYPALALLALALALQAAVFLIEGGTLRLVLRLVLAALAADEGSTSKVYTVTKDISYSTAGEIPDTVEEGQDLTVELKDQSEAKIVSAYAEIKDSAAPKNLLAKSDNPNESKLVFANQSTNGDRTPNMSTQELTPAMKSFYSNSYLITKSAGDLDYDSCNAALFAEKPATVSLGFWIQKTDNMVDEFPFWLIYQNKENYGERYLQVNIPVKDLVAGGKNTRQTVSLEGKNQNLIVRALRQSAWKIRATGTTSPMCCQILSISTRMRPIKRLTRIWEAWSIFI